MNQKISELAVKATPVADDVTVIIDSADPTLNKKITVGTLPISSATQTALDLKEGTITAGTTSQYYRGDKTFQTLDKAAVDLANVDNTSDANKPVSTAQQTEIDTKISKNVGATYTTNEITTVTQAEYDAIDPKIATTLYFIV